MSRKTLSMVTSHEEDLSLSTKNGAMTNVEVILIVVLVYVEVALLVLHIAVRLRRLYRLKKLERRLKDVDVFSNYIL